MIWYVLCMHCILYIRLKATHFPVNQHMIVGNVFFQTFANFTTSHSANCSSQSKICSIPVKTCNNCLCLQNCFQQPSPPPSLPLYVFSTSIRDGRGVIHIPNIHRSTLECVFRFLFQRFKCLEVEKTAISM